MSQYFHKKTVRQVPLDGTTVLLRADYNLPLHDDGTIADEYRLTQSLPTLKYLLQERKCAVVICSHLGRSDGRRVPKYSLRPVAKRLATLLGTKVRFIDECVGDKPFVATKRLAPGEVVMMENLRFHKGEEANSAKFAQQLKHASHARYFVQDGFGVVHRKHASTDTITHYLPSVGGLLIEKEYQHILGALRHPKRPLTAVLGGAKVSDKIEAIDNFINLADQIVIGGAMANTFLAYSGIDVGKSRVEPDEASIISKIYYDVAKKVGIDRVNDFILLPRDVAVAETLDPKQPRKEVGINNVHGQEMILDMGTHSINRTNKVIGTHGTVIWNGTLGVAEIMNFAYASSHLAWYLASHSDIVSIIGGGDTVDFVLDWKKRNKGVKNFTHISTGGGASLELMAGKKLPGVEALLKE